MVGDRAGEGPGVLEGRSGPGTAAGSGGVRVSRGRECQGGRRTRGAGFCGDLGSPAGRPRATQGAGEVVGAPPPGVQGDCVGVRLVESFGAGVVAQ